MCIQCNLFPLKLLKHCKLFSSAYWAVRLLEKFILLGNRCKSIRCFEKRLFRLGGVIYIFLGWGDIFSKQNSRMHGFLCSWDSYLSNNVATQYPADELFNTALSWLSNVADVSLLIARLPCAICSISLKNIWLCQVFDQQYLNGVLSSLKHSSDF